MHTLKLIARAAYWVLIAFGIAITIWFMGVELL
jgi:hypothetical protein